MLLNSALRLIVHQLLFIFLLNSVLRIAATDLCASDNGNCALPAIVNNYIGTAQKCNLATGLCGAGSCSGNGISNNNNQKPCNGGTCTITDISGVGTAKIGCVPYNLACDVSKSKCFGITNCSSGYCPSNYLGLVCFYQGNSNTFNFCACDESNGFVSQCPTTSCGYSYTGAFGSPSTCSAPSFCPKFSQCLNGHCALPGPDTDCACSSSDCIGRCCPTTGKCQAASCDGNKINNPSGIEQECVLNMDGTNSGGQCPWGGYSFGVKCYYLAGCRAGVKNNCWGYTACGTGTCPDSAIGVFCMESGNSDNFKVCGCSGTNTVGLAANCSAAPPPQAPVVIASCANGNCAPALPDASCLDASNCPGPGTCIGRCCSSTGKCAAASCYGNKINSPSGHERECVFKPGSPNAGSQCPWAGKSYSVACSYLAACVPGVKSNCWGYTTCASGACPSSALGVFCIESGSSNNFKVCGCSGEGTSIGAGGAVAYSNCVVRRTSLVNVTGPYNCPAGYYCPTACSAFKCPCGYYCPAGSTAPFACTSNSYCLEGSTSPSPNPFVCPAGYFCPISRTVNKFYCNMTACPCGSYCPANSTAPIPCPAGKFCTQNASAPTPCPAGSFCPSRACSGLSCPCGSRCPYKTSGPQMCAPPFYCPDTGMSTQALCPVGYVCPSIGMCKAIPCPLGSYVSCGGKVTCDGCPAGRYCPNVTRNIICAPGFYCPANSTSGVPCPAGSYCHIGSAIYKTCPAGFYCPPNASVNILCPKGGVCPTAGMTAAVPCSTAMTLGMTACPARRSLDARHDPNTARRTLLAEKDHGGDGPQDHDELDLGQAAVYSAFTWVGLFVIGLVVRAVWTLD